MLMVRAILRDEQVVLPIAARLSGQFGIDGVYVGVPARLGRGGRLGDRHGRARRGRGRRAAGRRRRGAQPRRRPARPGAHAHRLGSRGGRRVAPDGSSVARRRRPRLAALRTGFKRPVCGRRGSKRPGAVPARTRFLQAPPASPRRRRARVSRLGTCTGEHAVGQVERAREGENAEQPEADTNGLRRAPQDDVREVVGVLEDRPAVPAQHAAEVDADRSEQGDDLHGTPAGPHAPESLDRALDELHRLDADQEPRDCQQRQLDRIRGGSRPRRGARDRSRDTARWGGTRSSHMRAAAARAR